MSFNPTVPHSLDFLPPKKALKNEDFYELLLKARVELAELKGSCGQVPNPLLLTAPLLIRESVESSGIENINTTIANVLENQLLPEAERNAPDKEVLHYREALHWGFSKLSEVGMTNRLILGIQKKLIPSGSGEYRRLQNSIENARTKEVLYTPPIASDIPKIIGDWEKFVNESKDFDPLIRVAIAHYQFEAIHPFSDGNGRTGRILMVLQLVHEEILEMPILFISGFINKNKVDYYRLLREVTSKDGWYEYIAFMLEGFYLQAKETKEALKKVKILHDEMKSSIKHDHSSIYSADLLEALFTYPVINPTHLARELDCHYVTAGNYLRELEKAGMLISAKVGRNHFFVNKELVSILSR